jgi:hypothetical protein
MSEVLLSNHLSPEREAHLKTDMPNHSESTREMRSGKWSLEEESFANRLVYEFENGWLSDCEEGCTLRSYLAKKLNCAPMRISKKFAGRCIGKLAFTKNATNNVMPNSEVNQLNELKQQYESSFKPSIGTKRSRRSMSSINSDTTSAESGNDSLVDNIDEEHEAFKIPDVNSAWSTLDNTEDRKFVDNNDMNFMNFDFFDGMLNSERYIAPVSESHGWQDVMFSHFNDESTLYNSYY